MTCTRKDKRTEQHRFKWKDIKNLKRKELFHLFIESDITGWDTVQQQKSYHAKERTFRTGPYAICWECEDIFKKIKRPKRIEKRKGA
jgi:hypothetical protein